MEEFPHRAAVAADRSGKSRAVVAELDFLFAFLIPHCKEMTVGEGADLGWSGRGGQRSRQRAGPTLAAVVRPCLENSTQTGAHKHQQAAGCDFGNRGLIDIGEGRVPIVEDHQFAVAIFVPGAALVVRITDVDG